MLSPVRYTRHTAPRVHTHTAHNSKCISHTLGGYLFARLSSKQEQSQHLSFANISCPQRRLQGSQTDAAILMAIFPRRRREKKNKKTGGEQAPVSVNRQELKRQRGQRKFFCCSLTFCDWHSNFEEQAKSEETILKENILRRQDSTRFCAHRSFNQVSN